MIVCPAVVVRASLNLFTVPISRIPNLLSAHVFVHSRLIHIKELSSFRFSSRHQKVVIRREGVFHKFYIVPVSQVRVDGFPKPKVVLAVGGSSFSLLEVIKSIYASSAFGGHVRRLTRTKTASLSLPHRCCTAGARTARRRTRARSSSPARASRRGAPSGRGEARGRRHH